MNALILDHILEEVHVALLNNDFDKAVQAIEALRPADQAELISELSNSEQVTLLNKFMPRDSANILEEMDDEDAAELVASLPRETVIPIVDAMEPDEAADLLGDIRPEQAQSLLKGMESSAEVRPLMHYSEDTAGGLMTNRYLALRSNMRPEEAIRAIREWDVEDENHNYFFIVNPQGVLLGLVNLYQIIRADPKASLSDFMDPDVIHVNSKTDQEECARLMSRYDLMVMPVVNNEGIMVGIITFDDIIEVVEDEATEDIQRMGATEPLEGGYLNTGVGSIVRKRIGWLLLLFITETLTGTVLRHFEAELQAEVALSFFVPLLIGTGGNAGSQTTSTIIRALAVGDIEWKDALLSLWHEMRIGLLLGTVMCVVAFIRALTWGSSPALAATVAAAIFSIVLWANTLGAILPLAAERLKIDPTVVSGPVMSTLVDATGLFIYLTIAKMILHI